MSSVLVSRISGETTCDHQENADKQWQNFPNSSKSNKEIDFSIEVQKLLVHNQQLEMSLKISSQQCDMLIKNSIDRSQKGRGNTSHLEAGILNLVWENQGLNEQNLELARKIIDLEQLKQNFENQALELKLMLDNTKLELASKMLCVESLQKQLGQKCAENYNLILKNRELTSSFSLLTSDLNCLKKSEIWYKEQYSRLKSGKKLLTQVIFESRVQLLNRRREVESLQLEVAKWKSKCDEIQLELQHAKQFSQSSERKICDSTSVKSVVDETTANDDNYNRESDLHGELKVGNIILHGELKEENTILKQYIREQEKAFAKVNKDHVELMHKYLLVQQKLEIRNFETQDLNNNLNLKTASEAENSGKLIEIMRIIAYLKTELDANIQEKQVTNDTVRTIRHSFAILRNKYRALEKELAQKNVDILQLQKEKQEFLEKNLEKEDGKECATCGMYLPVQHENEKNFDETDHCRLMDIGKDSNTGNLIQIDPAVKGESDHKYFGENIILSIKRNNLQEICEKSKRTKFSSPTGNYIANVPHKKPPDIGDMSQANLILMLAKILRIFNCDMNLSNIRNSEGLQCEIVDLEVLIKKIIFCCEITKQDNRLKDEIIYKLKNMNNQQNELICLITDLEEKCGRLQRKICKNNVHALTSFEVNPADKDKILGESIKIEPVPKKLLLPDKIEEKPYKIERHRRLNHRLLRKVRGLTMKKNLVEKRLSCMKKMYHSLLNDYIHMRPEGILENEEIESLQNISNEDNEETQNSLGENEIGLIFDEKHILSKQSPACINSSDFESPPDGSAQKSSYVVENLKKCEEIEQNREGAALPGDNIFWNSSSKKLFFQEMFIRKTDYRNHCNAEMKLNHSSLEEISEELKRLQDQRTDNEKRYSKKYSEMQNLILVLKSQLDRTKCEFESVKNEKFFLQRLCSDLRIALKAHMDLNQEQQRNFFRTLLPSLPVMPSFDENYINELIKKNKVMCQVKPLSGCQEEFQKLRKKVVMLQKQIFEEENRDIIDVQHGNSIEY